MRRPRVILASRPAKALFLAVFVAIALPAVLYKIPPMAGADSAFVVLSGSMEPVLAPGDLIFIEEVPGDSLRVGDIATFKPDPRGDVLVTHRVIEVLPEGSGVRYRTQG
ncbi:MAG TPA: signal peptidase I, partial [Candidatus Thermoplasmatota archaeon]|nr:signal peptidase I [Candidatus Thermoplasmatota archaeon]